jgi:hypothetical protein
MAYRSLSFGEVRLEKHDSGYQVTLRTTLRESDESDGDSGGLVSFSWIIIGD